MGQSAGGQSTAPTSESWMLLVRGCCTGRFYRNFQDEFCSAWMPLNAELSTRLFEQSFDNPHSQTISLRDLKVGSQPGSLIADRKASDGVVHAADADLNRPASAIGICMLGGIGDQLGHNERQIDGPIRVEEEFVRCNEHDVTIRHNLLQVAANIRQVGGHFNFFDLRAAIEPVM